MRRFLGSGAWLFAGIMAGRILGLVRDILVSRFGASVQADIAVLAITVPDAMINILIGGAMGAALIPEFKRLDSSRAYRLLRQAGTATALAALVVALGLMAFAEPLTKTLLQALPEENVPYAAQLVRISLWAVPLTALSAVARARLQSLERFALPSMAGFFYNLSILVGVSVAASNGDLRPVAFSAVAGALLSLVMQLADVARSRGPVQPELGWLVDWPLVRRYGGALAAGSLVLLLPLVTRAFASRYGPGSQVIAYFAGKLVELPMGTLLSVVSIAMFPAIAEALANPDRIDEATHLARQGIRVTTVLAAPIALGIGFFAGDYARLLFGHGEMTAVSITEIGTMSAIMLVGLIFQAANTMLLSFFNALRDMQTPFFVGMVALGLFFAAGWGSPNVFVLGACVAGFHIVLCVAMLFELRRRHGIDLSGSLFGLAAIRQITVTILAFAIFAYPLSVVVHGTLGRVLVSIACGSIAAVIAIVSDPDIRVKFRDQLWNKLVRRTSR